MALCRIQTNNIPCHRATVDQKEVGLAHKDCTKNN